MALNAAEPGPLSRSLIQVVLDFWRRPIRAESLALFRILLGLTILGAILTGIGTNLVETCGPDPICPPEALDVWLADTGRLCLLRGPANLPLLGDWLPATAEKSLFWINAQDTPWLNQWLTPDQARAWADWGATPEAAYLLFGLYVGSLVFFTLGCFTRTATLAALVLANTFHHRLPEMMNGGDSLFRNGLYFLLFAPAGAAWSLDRTWRLWRARRRGLAQSSAPIYIPPWSVRLMQIQVCIMYFVTGMVKASSDWLTGEAIYWVLNDVSICRWSYADLPIPLIVCRILSWATLLFEIGFSFFMLSGRLRPWVLLAGLSLHLSILAVMEIGWFSQVSLCWYALFLRGEDVARFFRRFGIGREVDLTLPE